MRAALVALACLGSGLDHENSGHAAERVALQLSVAVLIHVGGDPAVGVAENLLNGLQIRSRLIQ